MLVSVALVAFFAIVPGSVSALGINCRGSTDCSSRLGADATGMNTLHGILTGLPADRWYNSGQQLACTTGPYGGGICVFAQNTNGVTAGTAAHALGDLLYHGCAICGSIPINPGNDVSTGEVTVNYVGNPCRRDVGPC